MKHIAVLYKILFVLLLEFTAVATINAQTPTQLNINSGNIVIPSTPNVEYVITGNGTVTSNTITIESGYVGTITLQNVKITRTGANAKSSSCMTVKGRYFTGTTMTEDTKKSNLNPLTIVNFILDGTNEFYLFPDNTSGTNATSEYCAIQVDRGAQIHISAKDPNDNTSGVLIAKSTIKQPGDGTNRNYGNGGAGIGSKNFAGTGTNSNQGKIQIFNNGVEYSQRFASGGNIIISSGTITAWGGHGAGIGGGWYTFYDGIIVVYGGVVNARTATHSAGIGSGCPDGYGVRLQYYADNSMILALPPSDITAFGGETNFMDLSQISAADLATLANLGLNGSQTVAYMNDPNKPLITIHTQPLPNGSDLNFKEKNADIYLDLSETIVKGTTTIQDVFNTLGITYDLKKVRVGRTDATSGDFELHGQFDQETTFFTDAFSTIPAYLGRPFMPVRQKVTAATTIALPLLQMNISFTDYPSTPLEEGYTAQQARRNAHTIKMEYNDLEPMTNLEFRLQGGGVDFETMVFLAADSVTELINPPAQLNQGDKYFIVLPLKEYKLIGIYSDVLLIGGSWGTTPLPGYIRRIGEQRVVKNDIGINEHIKVTASPVKFVDNTFPATQTVDLTLNINHGTTGVNYDPLDVKARYLITTHPRYEDALAANPNIHSNSSAWKSFTIPTGNGVNSLTNVSFTDMAKGVYYIHWYVTSGVVYAHSEDISNPLKDNGAFGPYIIADALNAGAIKGNPSVCKDQTPSEIKGEVSTGGSGSYSYQWQISTDGTNWSNITVNGDGQSYTPVPLTASPTYFQRITTDSYGSTATSNTFLINIVPDGLTFYWKQNATDNNWNNPDNWVDVNGAPLNMIPVGCSNVYIPGGITNYPSLHPDKTPVDLCGEPVCGNITFAYGAELIYQHKLTYEKAYVQYNWGYYDGFSGVSHGDQPTGNTCTYAAKKRDMWYALAAPLKSMATGDFAFAGYPLTWQAGFAMSHPETGNSGGEIVVGNFDKTFSTNDKPLSETNNAIAVKVALYDNLKGYDDHCNLEGLQGIIEIPYFENSAKAAYYPGHLYDRFTKESKFFYFNPLTLQLIHSPVGIMKRGEEAYRFIYEDNNGTTPNITVTGVPSSVPGYELKKVKSQNSTSDKKVMVGNPFMASINAKQFFDANGITKLDKSEGYLLFNSETQIWNRYEFDDAGKIPPLHAFIVTLISDDIDLLFPLEGTYALAGLSLSVPPGGLGRSLYLKSISSDNLEGDYSVLAAAETDEAATNVKKMIYSQGHATPETFFISPDNSDYNLIQAYEEGIREIGIGVKSSDTKNAQSLIFENVENFYTATGIHPVLVDKYMGTKQDLILYSTYSFTQRNVESKDNYIDKDRFALQLLSDEELFGYENGISIAYRDKQLEVNAISTIKEIQIYDILGRKIYSDNKISTTMYTRSLSLVQGVYIVKVYTENGGTKIDKIMAL